MAKLVLKVIKTKEFTANEEPQTHYTCAYKGRMFGVSTVQWSEDLGNLEHDEEASKLTINSDVEVTKTGGSVDPLTGEILPSFLNIVPKIDITLAAF